MAILAVGGIGQVGSPIAQKLTEHGAEVVVLTQDPGKAHLPPVVRAVKGDVLDPETMRGALRGMTHFSFLTLSSPTN